MGWRRAYGNSRLDVEDNGYGQKEGQEDGE
jgi:hypothetical protein